MKLYLYTLTVYITYIKTRTVHFVSDKNNDLKTEQDQRFRKFINNKLNELYISKYGEKPGSNSISCKEIKFQHFLSWKLEDDEANNVNHFVNT